MKVPYKRYSIEPTAVSASTELFRPMVPLRVIGPTGDAFLWALVDTGADQTVLPRAIAEEIGVSIDDDRGWQVGGFGGQTVNVAPADVTLQLGYAGQSFEWDVTVGFVDFAQPEDEITLLGHVGFLDFFRATFDGLAHELELAPTAAFPGREQ